ncbi:DNA-processing protein DprA [Teredinibacter franksiae]|uniref:DNA-processing protein DprA n=1 Tax=Teredinibacter franksiae TaxID=2761453 RepID=UPI001FE8100F|nr:DNA-processing protein DprA [Teredinibacter franksiae]
MLSAVEQKLLFQQLPGVGAASYWKLMERSPSLSSVLESPPDTFADIFSEEARQLLREFQHAGEDCALVRKIRADLAWAEQHEVQVIDTDDEHYPELLREIKRPPPLLYVAGDVTQLSFPQVAVVGSRNPSPSGRGSAFEFSKSLASAGFTITSGLALGIDAAAHQGALACQGKTIAVLGTGIDQVYPQRNKQIADQIVANGGALVSEFPLGTSAQPANFPQRNRIISGLSYGTLVVEAAVRSGSLITARYALQQNRELFAIPGSIHNPLARGCHSLIKDGAKLVESAEDIVAELNGFLQLKWEQLNLDKVPDTRGIVGEMVATEHEDIVLQQLGYEPTAIDALTERTNLPVGDVMACLLTLELKGMVANIGTGYMRIRHDARTTATGLSFNSN